MNHADVLRQSASAVNELTNAYGPREMVFDRAARLASILVNREVSPYEVAMITMALNLGHLQENRGDPKNYVSSIVNVAFAAQFGAATHPDPQQELFAGVEEIAKMFGAQGSNQQG